MFVPIRLYFEKETGRVFHQTGNFEDLGLNQVPSVEKDIADYKQLSERNRETFDVLELPFGAYEQDFAEGRLIGVDLETKLPKFEYANPENPSEPVAPKKPLTMQIDELKAENLATMDALAEVYEMILGGM